MSQLNLFEISEPKKRKIAKKQTEYKFPWTFHYKTDMKSKDGYYSKLSPFQIKIFNYLEQKKCLEYVSSKKNVSFSALLKNGGCGMLNDIQKTLSAYLKKNYKQSWFNFRHKKRGAIKWKNISLHEKIWLRGNEEELFQNFTKLDNIDLCEKIRVKPHNENVTFEFENNLYA